MNKKDNCCRYWSPHAVKMACGEIGWQPVVPGPGTEYRDFAHRPVDIGN